MLDFLNNTDTRLFLFLNGFHSPFWDGVMLAVSGKAEWIPLYVLILAWLVYRLRLRSVPIIVAVVLLIVLSDQLSVILFKNTVHRLRPCHNPAIQDFVHLVRNHCGGKYGFISNHAANTFALAAFTSFVFRNRLYSLFIFIWALLVSYSRIYLGVHYPGDLLAGAVFGVILAYGIRILYMKIARRKGMSLFADLTSKD